MAFWGQEITEVSERLKNIFQNCKARTGTSPECGTWDRGHICLPGRERDATASCSWVIIYWLMLVHSLNNIFLCSAASMDSHVGWYNWGIKWILMDWGLMDLSTCGYKSYKADTNRTEYFWASIAVFGINSWDVLMADITYLWIVDNWSTRQARWK